jgi:hypothetical protein
MSKHELSGIGKTVQAGEATTRDRIADDANDRFRRVLALQQDLEREVADLRESLRTAELDRERLRADMSVLETRIDAASGVHGDGLPPPDFAERVATAVIGRLDARPADAGRRDGPVLDAARVTESLRRIEQSADEARRSVLLEFALLRESLDGARSVAEGAQAERLRRIEERVAAASDDGSGDLVRPLECLAECTAAVDESLRALRGELADVVQRAAGAAERRHDAVESLQVKLARDAAVQAATLQAGFAAALEHALDEITRAMQAAAAVRPAEARGDAEEMLVARAADAKDGEPSANHGRRDVEERRSRGSVATSASRLTELNGATRKGTGRTA